MPITFDPTGGKLNGKTDPTVDEYNPGDPVTIADAPTRKGYKFVEWNTKKDGSGDPFQPGDVTEFSKAMTFYAVWEKEEPTLLEITYDPNGGVFRGSTDPISIEYEKYEIITIAEAPTRKGYKFLYWKGSEYSPGDKYEVTEHHTFVAQWEKIPEKKTDKKDTKKKDKKKSPETGDNTFMINWYTLMILAQIMLVVLLAYKIRREESE